MHTIRPRGPVAAALATLALLITVACTGQSADAPAPRPGSAATSQVRALAVKIDNVVPARPPTGLEQADIVYVEQVEAGLSRILAVYSAAAPRVVGPVRSARESDLDILRQFDRPTLAYSGVQTKLVPLVEAAPLDALSPSTAPDAYFRSRDRAAPHNLYLRPPETPFAASGVNAAEALGLRPGPPPSGGRTVREQTVRYPSARFDFTWSADGRRWLVGMDGAPARTAEGEHLDAGTVIVQRVTVRPSDFRDRSGNTTPFTETVGSGTATVLRDGKAYDATWVRERLSSRTEFTGPDGKRMTFAPGQVWIVYAAR
ncbi:DUF3048 domain-containing protein [Streptomyces hypolithicus]